MIVLIDDDKLMHLSWKLRADKAGKQLQSYFSMEEFIESNHANDLDLAIYIDSNLRNDIKGELEAKKLYERGFKNLFLSTGYDDLNVGDYPWLKGIISKRPPF